MYVIGSLELVEQAISTINLQGEGSDKSPEKSAGMLAHFYEFGEIYNGRQFVKTNGRWGSLSMPVVMPQVFDMADIPSGGYQQLDVRDPEVWDLIERFDRTYSEMLRLLQRAWLNGDVGTLSGVGRKDVPDRVPQRGRSSPKSGRTLKGTMALASVTFPDPSDGGQACPQFLVDRPCDLCCGPTEEGASGPEEIPGLTEDWTPQPEASGQAGRC